MDFAFPTGIADGEFRVPDMPQKLLEGMWQIHSLAAASHEKFSNPSRINHAKCSKVLVCLLDRVPRLVS
jgi:hypothetical protein